MRRILTTLAIGLFSAGSASAAQIQAGSHYIPLSPAQPTSSSPDKIEVAEVFTYECIHCFSFEPRIQKWLQNKPADVAFVRIPAVFNARWQPAAKAYFVAEVNGMLEEITQDYFRAVHLEKRRMYDEDAVADFFVARGLDEEKFRADYNSFAVAAKMQRADQLARRYKVLATPTIVVNGKYKVFAGRQLSGVNNWDDVIEVVDYLIEKERQER